MARQVDLGTLTRRLRWRTDTENETQRFPDSEAYDCLNEGIAQFHAEIVRADGQGYAAAETFFMSSIGQEMYAMPAEFLEVTEVAVLVDGRDRKLAVYDQWDRDALSNTSNWFDCGFGYYRIVGDNISLMSVPTAVRKVTVRYVATAVRLLAPTNTLDGIDGCEEFAVAWAAQRFAFKNGYWDLNDRLMADKAETLDRMRALVVNRNASEPNRVGDAAGKRVNRGWNRFAMRGRW